MTEMTSKNEILESLRAIKVAASERHAALKNEMAELEAAFPELAPRRLAPIATAKRTYSLSPGVRASKSAKMKAHWAARRENGATASVQ